MLVLLVRVAVIASSDPIPPPTSAGVPSFADALIVRGTAPVNLDAGKVASLRSTRAALEISAGELTFVSGSCGEKTITTVSVTLAVTKGSAVVDPAWFQLETVSGGTVTALADCYTGVTELEAGERATVEMPFEARDPKRLVFGADPHQPQAVWQLS
ncbi:hypothetical protein [Actinoplanes friuliensis]|uniref:hypothetical protein n=1 Tax=Actinoplanes friuliensis TaxID=196914 RepID=UPI0011DCA82E|nr:hypothetical protein [Actinoplanes friuliensis]